MIHRLCFIPSQDYLVQQINHLLPFLPEWRRQQTLRMRTPLGQWQCAQAYMLLMDLLHEEYGLTEPPAFDYLPKGKPVLRDFPDIHFSLSHCAEAVLCIVDDDHPVGCDVESFTLPDEQLLHLACNEQERQMVLHSAQPEVEFTSLWTQKEALLKYYGEGINDSLPHVLEATLPSDLLLATEVKRSKRFVYTLCYTMG